MWLAELFVHFLEYERVKKNREKYAYFFGGEKCFKTKVNMKQMK
jgi:hypothetical protein